jgi:hypothetical protein
VSTEKRRRAAAALIRRGAAPIPVPAGEKNSGRPDWESLRISEEEISNYWTIGQNIGLLCGEPSGDRVDVDLDPDKAVKIGLGQRGLAGGRNCARWLVCGLRRRCSGPIQEDAWHVAAAYPAPEPDSCNDSAIVRNTDEVSHVEQRPDRPSEIVVTHSRKDSKPWSIFEACLGRI